MSSENEQLFNQQPPKSKKPLIAISDSSKETMDSMLHWVYYDVAFALIPLGISLFFRTLAGSTKSEPGDISHELLFFVLVICGLAMGNIQELPKPLGWSIFLRLLFMLSSFGAGFAAMLFGAVVYDKEVVAKEIIDKPATFENHLLFYVFALACFSASVCFATQLLTTRIKIAIKETEDKHA